MFSNDFDLGAVDIDPEESDADSDYIDPEIEAQLYAQIYHESNNVCFTENDVFALEKAKNQLDFHPTIEEDDPKSLLANKKESHFGDSISEIKRNTKEVCVVLDDSELKEKDNSETSNLFNGQFSTTAKKLKKSKDLADISKSRHILIAKRRLKDQSVTKFKLDQGNSQDSDNTSVVHVSDGDDNSGDDGDDDDIISLKGMGTVEINLDDVSKTLLVNEEPDKVNTAQIWKIDAKDKYKLSSLDSRYYKRHTQSHFRCYNCHEKGHLSKCCTQPRKFPVCHICSGPHYFKRCTEVFCNNCLCPGHRQKDCTERRKWKLVCRRCFMKGHTKEDCPDQWRMYHLTTGMRVPVRSDDPSRPTSNIWCWNCATKGHFGFECFEKRMDNRVTPVIPFVKSYEEHHGVKRKRELMEQGLELDGLPRKRARLNNPHSTFNCDLEKSPKEKRNTKNGNSKKMKSKELRDLQNGHVVKEKGTAPLLCEQQNNKNDCTDIVYDNSQVVNKTTARGNTNVQQQFPFLEKDELPQSRSEKLEWFVNRRIVAQKPLTGWKNTLHDLISLLQDRQDLPVLALKAVSRHLITVPLDAVFSEIERLKLEFPKQLTSLNKLTKTVERIRRQNSNAVRYVLKSLRNESFDVLTVEQTSKRHLQSINALINRLKRLYTQFVQKDTISTPSFKFACKDLMVTSNVSSENLLLKFADLSAYTTNREICRIAFLLKYPLSNKRLKRLRATVRQKFRNGEPVLPDECSALEDILFERTGRRVEPHVITCLSQPYLLQVRNDPEVKAWTDQLNFLNQQVTKYYQKPHKKYKQGDPLKSHCDEIQMLENKIISKFLELRHSQLPQEIVGKSCATDSHGENLSQPVPKSESRKKVTLVNEEEFIAEAKQRVGKDTHHSPLPDLNGMSKFSLDKPKAVPVDMRNSLLEKCAEKADGVQKKKDPALRAILNVTDFVKKCGKCVPFFKNRAAIKMHLSSKTDRNEVEENCLRLLEMLDSECKDLYHLFYVKGSLSAEEKMRHQQIVGKMVAEFNSIDCVLRKQWTDAKALEKMQHPC